MICEGAPELKVQLVKILVRSLTLKVCCAACVKPAAKKAEVKKSPAAAERKSKPASQPVSPRRPPSRKPVGTPARAAGKRSASIPARLRPLDNTPYRRKQAQGAAFCYRMIHEQLAEVVSLLLYHCNVS